MKIPKSGLERACLDALDKLGDSLVEILEQDTLSPDERRRATARLAEVEQQIQDLLESIDARD